jgi:hypothetical protein
MTNDKMNRAYETYETYGRERIFGVLRLRHPLAVIRSSKQASSFAKASEDTSWDESACGRVWACRRVGVWACGRVGPKGLGNLAQALAWVARPKRL